MPRPEVVEKLGAAQNVPASAEEEKMEDQPAEDAKVEDAPANDAKVEDEMAEASLDESGGADEAETGEAEPES